MKWAAISSAGAFLLAGVVWTFTGTHLAPHWAEALALATAGLGMMASGAAAAPRRQPAAEEPADGPVGAGARVQRATA